LSSSSPSSSPSSSLESSVSLTPEKVKQVMINGMNLFFGYFGVPVPENENYIQGIEFTIDTTDNTRYDGIELTFTTDYSKVTLKIQDTTKKNIAEFVNKFDGIISDDKLSKLQMTESEERLFNFAKCIYHYIPQDIKEKNTNNNVLTIIVIALKALGDLWQVHFSKKISELCPELKLYISSSDKNVSAESFLLNGKFWSIGTGIRPHMDFFERYPKFFSDKLLFRSFTNSPDIENSSGSDIVDYRDVDTTKAIITNTKLENQAAIIANITNSIDTTLTKISSLDLDLPDDLELPYDLELELELRTKQKELKNLEKKIPNIIKSKNPTKGKELTEQIVALEKEIQDLEQLLIKDNTFVYYIKKYKEIEGFEGFIKTYKDNPIVQMIFKEKILGQVLNDDGLKNLYKLLLFIQSLNSYDDEDLNNYVKNIKLLNSYIKDLYEVLKLVEIDQPPESLSASSSSSSGRDTSFGNSTFFKKVKTSFNFLKLKLNSTFAMYKNKDQFSSHYVVTNSTQIVSNLNPQKLKKNLTIFNKNLSEFAKKYLIEKYSETMTKAEHYYQEQLQETLNSVNNEMEFLIASNDKRRRNERNKTKNMSERLNELEEEIKQLEESSSNKKKLENLKKKYEKETTTANPEKAKKSVIDLFNLLKDNITSILQVTNPVATSLFKKTLSQRSSSSPELSGSVSSSLLTLAPVKKKSFFPAFFGSKEGGKKVKTIKKYKKKYKRKTINKKKKTMNKKRKSRKYKKKYYKKYTIRKK
jgi:hypothetical protein